VSSPSAGPDGAGHSGAALDRADRLSSAVYGLMVTAVTMIAGSGHDDSLLRLLLLTLATNVVYFLTHLFAEVIVPRPGVDPETSLRHHAWVSGPMVTAGFTPMLVTALGHLAGMDLADAVWLGLGWVAVGFGAVAWFGLRSRGVSAGHRMLAIAAVVGVFALLVGAKLSLH